MGGRSVHGPGDDRTHRRKSLIGCFPHRIASQRLSEFQFQTTSHRIVPPETKSNRIVGELWGSGASRGGSAVGQSCGGELRGGDVGELWPQRVGHLAPGYAVLPNLRLQPSNVNLDYDPV